MLAASPFVGTLIGNLLGGWLSDNVLGKSRKPNEDMKQRRENRYFPERLPLINHTPNKIKATPEVLQSVAGSLNHGSNTAAKYTRA